MELLWVLLAVPVALVIAVWAGSRMLRDNGGTSSGGNALGGFNVFDPARERAEHDLESQKHQTVVTPAAGDGDRRLQVDTGANTVRIRRPTPADPPGDLPTDASA